MLVADPGIADKGHEEVACDLNGAVGIEKTDAGSHMNGALRAIHVSSASEAGAVRPVKWRRRCGGWVDLGDSVHGVVDLLYGSSLSYGGRAEGG